MTARAFDASEFAAWTRAAAASFTANQARPPLTPAPECGIEVPLAVAPQVSDALYDAGWVITRYEERRNVASGGSMRLWFRPGSSEQVFQERREALGGDWTREQEREMQEILAMRFPNAPGGTVYREPLVNQSYSGTARARAGSCRQCMYAPRRAETRRHDSARVPATPSSGRTSSSTAA